MGNGFALGVYFEPFPPRIVSPPTALLPQAEYVLQKRLDSLREVNSVFSNRYDFRLVGRAR
jgi:hypothetical protein